MKDTIRNQLLERFLMKHPLLSISTKQLLQTLVFMKDEEGNFLLKNEDDMEELANYIELNYITF